MRGLEGGVVRGVVGVGCAEGLDLLEECSVCSFRASSWFLVEVRMRDVHVQDFHG